MDDLCGATKQELVVGASEEQESALDCALLDAAELGNIDAVREHLRNGACAAFQRNTDGRSPLIASAANGHANVVGVLLEHGAPWNALDRRGQCAGQYAFRNGHSEIANQILNSGVTAELLFAALEKESRLRPALSATSNEQYISRPVEYKEGDLIDHDQRGVMMMWEKPIMEAHAELLCREKGDVLNIGFGLGLIDTAIQEYHPRIHTIIEAHPDVYRKMLEDGWDKNPGVKIIHARWQDVVNSLPQFDAIFFDTFDDVLHMHEFHKHLPQLLREGGVYSFFNGICPDNFFFHAVACQVLKIQLQELGFYTNFQPMGIECHDDKAWKNVKFRYFEDDTYHFPVVFWQHAPPKFVTVVDTSESPSKICKSQESDGKKQDKAIYPSKHD
eukprot:gene9872-2062_t